MTLVDSLERFSTALTSLAASPLIVFFVMAVFYFAVCCRGK